MASIGGGKMSPIFLGTELKSGKHHCSYMGVTGVFHNLPTARDMKTLSKIMRKYKCSQIEFRKAEEG